MFSIGDTVEWSDLAPEHFKHAFGDGPFSVVGIVDVAEPDKEQVGHSQLIVVETGRKSESEFSGKYFRIRGL